MDGLNPKERRQLKALSTPERIQDYLDALPINHEKRGDTCYSPRLVLQKHKAHCLEGAFLAAAALMLQGERPLLMNLKTAPGDDDHAVALFRRGGRWGAISKTNHAVLRYRDPVYLSLRELAMSYFHEYFLGDTGAKTLLAYSKPMNLRRFGTSWVSSEESLWDIAETLAAAPHIPLVPAPLRRKLRKATRFEREATGAVEWKRGDKRT